MKILEKTENHGAEAAENRNSRLKSNSVGGFYFLHDALKTTLYWHQLDNFSRDMQMKFLVVSSDPF